MYICDEFQTNVINVDFLLLIKNKPQIGQIVSSLALGGLTENKIITFILNVYRTPSGYM